MNRYAVAPVLATGQVLFKKMNWLAKEKMVTVAGTGDTDYLGLGILNNRSLIDDDCVLVMTGDFVGYWKHGACRNWQHHSFLLQKGCGHRVSL